MILRLVHRWFVLHGHVESQVDEAAVAASGEGVWGKGRGSGAGCLWCESLSGQKIFGCKTWHCCIGS